MIHRLPRNAVNPLSWLKALLLSPGMLFLFGYLAIYCTASIYMNGTFKKELQERYIRSRGSTHSVTIGSIRPDIGMNAITISRIELTPTESCPEKERRHVILDKLALALPELEKTLFSNRRLRESTSLVCNKIREEELKVQ
jgi:hypothetical protein